MVGCELSSRISKQWQDIGFQGDNPATDFRGMGVLSLRCLLYPTLLTSYWRNTHHSDNSLLILHAQQILFQSA